MTQYIWTSSYVTANKAATRRDVYKRRRSNNSSCENQHYNNTATHLKEMKARRLVRGRRNHNTRGDIATLTQKASNPMQ